MTLLISMKRFTSAIRERWLSGRMGSWLRRYGGSLLVTLILAMLASGFVYRDWRGSRALQTKRVEQKLFIEEKERSQLSDYRAVAVVLSELDSQNPLIREGQRVDLLIFQNLDSSRKEREEKTVTLLMEDLEVLAVSHRSAPISGGVGEERASRLLSGNGFALPEKPTLLRTVTLRVSSLEAMLLAFAQQNRRFRLIPRTAGAASHLDRYDIVSVSKNNFVELAIRNLTEEEARKTDQNGNRK